MNVALGIVLVVVVIGVVAIVILLVGGFKKTQPTAPDPAAMNAQYQPTSAWFGIVLENGVPKLDGSGNVTLNKNVASTTDPDPLRGGGACVTFTTLASSAYVPGFPIIVGGSIPGGIETPTQLTCVDDDQIFAKSVYHGCAGDMGLIIRSQDTCLGVDGTFYNKGKFERYYANCNVSQTANGSSVNKGRCGGSIGMIALGANLAATGPGIFTSAQCLKSDTYATDTGLVTGKFVDGSALNYIKGGNCQMNTVDSFGFPSQIYRIERAAYVLGFGFQPNDSGSFIRIVHRPTNTYVGPEFGATPTQLTTTTNLTLVPISRSTRSDGLKLDGYWWYLTPTLSDPSGSGTTQKLSKQYLAFVVNPETIPTTDPQKMWDFAISSYVMGYPSGGNFECIPFPTYTSQTANVVANQAQAQYFDYAILPLIMGTVSQYEFA